MSSSSYASFRCSRHRLYRKQQASKIRCKAAFWLFVTYNRYLYVFFLNMAECYLLIMKNSTGFRKGRSCVFLLHVHLLINYPPTVTISRLVNSLKGVSSRLIRKQKHTAISQALWGNALWSPSYFAGSCGGASLETIRSYIEQQNSPRE